MLYSSDHPVSLAMLVGVLLLSAVAAGLAVRWPRSAAISLPLLYALTRWVEYPVGYSSDAHVWPFRVALLLPVLGLAAGIALRLRRAPA